MKFIRTPRNFFHYCGPGDDAYTGLYMSDENGTPPPGGGGGAPPGGTPPAAPVAPWAAAGDKPWTVGDTGNAQPWWSAIPEAPVREHIAAKAYANPAVLAMANYNLTRLHTGNGNVVELPGEGATQEQRDAFYTKLGRPVDPAKYDFTPAWAEDVKTNKDFKPNEGFVKFGQTLAFKLGLSNTQAQTLASEYRTYERQQTTSMVDAEKTRNDTAVATLKTTYGTEYDTYIAAGTRAYQSLGLEAATTAALERSMGAAPVIDLLCRLGRASAEGTFKGGGGTPPGPGGNPNGMSGEQAAAEIDRLNKDAEFQKVYTTKNDPGNRDAVERMNALFARAGDKIKL